MYFCVCDCVCCSCGNCMCFIRVFQSCQLHWKLTCPIWVESQCLFWQRNKRSQWPGHDTEFWPWARIYLSHWSEEDGSKMAGKCPTWSLLMHWVKIFEEGTLIVIGINRLEAVGRVIGCEGRSEDICLWERCGENIDEKDEGKTLLD